MIGYQTRKFLKYVGLSILVAIPFFTIVFFLVHYVNKSEDEEIAFIATMLLITGVFTGRFLGNLWRNSLISNFTLFIVTFLMIGVGFVLILVIKSSITHQEFIIFAIMVFLFFLSSILLGLLVKLIREKIARQINIAESIAVNSKSELQLLQSQLSPHFLFNTLNNLYGLSLTGHEKLPYLLLKLSELLRYSVYDAKELYVPLQEEIDYLYNYIEFEKIRIGERLDLIVKMEENFNQEINIAPMLLIVFVENAFKHSKNTKDEKIFIEIVMEIWGNSILFRVKNSCKNVLSNYTKNSGLGLENVRKRLEFLYPGIHDLQLLESHDKFEANLRVNVR